MNLSDHFTTDEFQCACGCGFGRIAGDVSIILVRRLEVLRDAVGPVAVNSGCRCQSHNAAIGGSPTSAHCYGLAADLNCPDSATAFVLVKAAYAAGFRRIGIERGCIHVDVSTRPEHPQDVLFGWDRQEHLPAAV